MDPTRYLEALVNRRVSFRYARATLEFDLTRSLFSSAGVDGGTATLLREMEQFTQAYRGAPVVDTGCGTGTLGLSIGAALGSEVHATDRDALAGWFTARNARLNSVQCETAIGLGAPPVNSARPDGSVVTRSVHVCNIPAKAGEAVIRELMRRQAECAAASGTESIVGLVIVAPLASLLVAGLYELAETVLARRETSSHLAVVFTPARDFAGTLDVSGEGEGALVEANSAVEVPPEYIRDSLTFQGPFGPYQMTVAYNLPEFDSLGYATELAFKLMRRRRPAGSIFAWGTGQGHLVVGGLADGVRTSLTVADRDLLSVKTTAANLHSDHPGISCEEICAPCLAAAAMSTARGETDWMIVRSEPESGSLWAEELAESADHLLAPRGQLLVVSRSTSMSRLASHLKARFLQKESVRSRGYRADMLVRKR